MEKKYLLTLKLILALCCVILFCAQAYGILLQYYGRKTSIGVETIGYENMALPLLTICSAQATKVTNIDLGIVDEKYFREVTYNLDELILDVNGSNTNWELHKEVITMIQYSQSLDSTVYSRFKGLILEDAMFFKTR